MKIKKLAKLRVGRETLRNLDEASLGAAGGGTYGSMTSGTVFGGACCLGCGCVHTKVPHVCGSFATEGRDSCLCPEHDI